MNANIWLTIKKERGNTSWNYGLGRDENGVIYVSEIIYGGFGIVGSHNGKAKKLYKGERKKILMDLYKAISQELDLPCPLYTEKELEGEDKNV